ncbi:MAG TPA: DUF2232 domain-containing protein [Bacillota bacterium]
MPATSQTKPLVEAAILAGVAVVIGVAGAIIPAVGAISLFFWPLPLIILQMRHGLRVTVMALIVTAALTTLIIGPLQAVSIVGAMGFVALAYGYAFRRRLEPLRAYLLGGIGLATGLLLIFGLLYLTTGRNPATDLWSVMEASYNQVLKSYGANLPPDQLTLVQNQIAWTRTVITRYAAALLVGSAFFYALLQYALAESLLPRFGLSVKPFPAFARWQLPLLPILLVWAPALVVSRASGRFPALAPYVSAATNLFYLCSIIFVIEGLSVAYFYLTKLGVTKGLRVTIIVLLFIAPAAMNLAMWFGIFDFLFDYRRLRLRPER